MRTTTERPPRTERSQPEDERRGSSRSSGRANGNPAPRESIDSGGNGQDVDLDALREREPWAVRRWIYGERGYVRCVLVQHGATEDELADLVQEVFYQAIRSLPSFRGNAKLTTWLYSIARNVAYSHQRDAKQHSTLSSEMLSQIEADQEGPGPLNGSLDGPREDTIRRERSALLRKALQELPSHYAQIIRLRDLEEQSTSETAEALGITEVNTRVRLHRARKALRERLTGYF